MDASKFESWIDNFDNKTWYKFIKLVLPALALFGLIWAIWDNYDSNRQSRRIVEQISTQYVGDFPLQLTKISDRIKSAERRVVIAVDHPAYGCFSNPLDFTDYYNQLWSKCNQREFANFKELKLICYDSLKRRTELRKQFKVTLEQENDTAFYCDYVPEGAKKSDWKTKLQGFEVDNNVGPFKTFGELFHEMEKKNSDFLHQLETKLGSRFTLIELKNSQEPLPLYFWMFDNDNSAFISFKSYGQLTKEVTISTSDPSILDYLKSIIYDIEEQNNSN